MVLTIKGVEKVEFTLTSTVQHQHGYKISPLPWAKVKSPGQIAIISAKSWAVSPGGSKLCCAEPLPKKFRTWPSCCLWVFWIHRVLVLKCIKYSILSLFSICFWNNLFIDELALHTSPTGPRSSLVTLVVPRRHKTLALGASLGLSGNSRWFHWWFAGVSDSKPWF